MCRVNRLDGENKEYGYIVDYRDLFKKLEKAVGAAYALFNLLMKGFDKKADAAIRRAQRKGDYTVTKETERQKVVAEMNQVLEKQNVTDVHFAFNANFPRPFLMPGAVPAWTDGNPQVASN